MILLRYQSIWTHLKMYVILLMLLINSNHNKVLAKVDSHSFNINSKSLNNKIGFIRHYLENWTKLINKGKVKTIINNDRIPFNFIQKKLNSEIKEDKDKLESNLVSNDTTNKEEDLTNNLTTSNNDTCQHPILRIVSPITTQDLKIAPISLFGEVEIKWVTLSKLTSFKGYDISLVKMSTSNEPIEFIIGKNIKELNGTLRWVVNEAKNDQVALSEGRDYKIVLYMSGERVDNFNLSCKKVLPTGVKVFLFRPISVDLPYAKLSCGFNLNWNVYLISLTMLISFYLN